MASKRAQRRKACTGKVRHLTPGAARAALASLLKVTRDMGRMNVYACRFCGGWHIGHSLNQKGLS